MKSIIVKGVKTECVGSIMIERAAFNEATNKLLWSILCKRLIDETRVELCNRLDNTSFKYAILSLTPNELEALVADSSEKNEEITHTLYTTHNLAVYVTVADGGTALHLCVVNFEIR